MKKNWIFLTKVWTAPTQSKLLKLARISALLDGSLLKSNVALALLLVVLLLKFGRNKLL